MVIKSAIRLLDPALKILDGKDDTAGEAIAADMDGSTRPYLQARPFDRFVFVISVLEGFTVRESAALLGCSPREVEQSRVRVLQQIAATGAGLPPSSCDAGDQAERASFFTYH